MKRIIESYFWLVLQQLVLIKPGKNFVSPRHNQPPSPNNTLCTIKVVRPTMTVWPLLFGKNYNITFRNLGWAMILTNIMPQVYRPQVSRYMYFDTLSAYYPKCSPSQVYPCLPVKNSVFNFGVISRKQLNYSGLLKPVHEC